MVSASSTLRQQRYDKKMNLQFFFDIFCKNFRYLYNIGKFIFAFLVFSGLVFVVCFSYHDTPKKQLCKYLFVLWCSFVFRYFAIVFETGNRPTKTDPQNRPTGTGPACRVNF